MNQTELIPHLFRTEYRKIVSVLCSLFGMEHMEAAEDIASDTFLKASELWGLKGLPENPTAWLYTVAKNKTKDYLKRNAHFAKKISPEIKYGASATEELEIDLSPGNINDSQLAMIFVVCHPCNPPEAQIALALNILCGFSADEIAHAFLTGREVVYKRMQRARKKLQTENIQIVPPSLSEINDRLPSVLTTLYLFYNEGYYSSSQEMAIREDLCFEAMRLTYLLIENEETNYPAVNALLSLMCFQSSRLAARFSSEGEMILYDDQDTALWNQELITRGEYFLNQASVEGHISKYILEAGIAYWHTKKTDRNEKWQSVLQLYNQLLLIEYSPITALNRTYALAKAHGKKEAIIEAEKINLAGHHLYHSLLGELYAGVNNLKSIMHWKKAHDLSKSSADKTRIAAKISEYKQNFGDKK